ncbi:hypothetical protein SDC9_194986 [bioreactor metagenome]|uniref:Uncharacterized protein n=1 Tax=bioreactor metagenome TaxID=1076179 RepID=A0A645IGF5_9ZZZZ
MKHLSADHNAVARSETLRRVFAVIEPFLHRDIGRRAVGMHNGRNVIKVCVRVSDHFFLVERLFLQLLKRGGELAGPHRLGERFSELQLRDLVRQAAFLRVFGCRFRELFFQPGRWRTVKPSVGARSRKQGMLSFGHQIFAPIPRSAVAKAPYCSLGSCVRAWTPN